MNQRQRLAADERESAILRALNHSHPMPMTATDVINAIAARVGYPTRATMRNDLHRLAEEGEVVRIPGASPRDPESFLPDRSI